MVSPVMRWLGRFAWRPFGVRIVTSDGRNIRAGTVRLADSPAGKPAFAVYGPADLRIGAGVQVLLRVGVQPGRTSIAFRMIPLPEIGAQRPPTRAEAAAMRIG